MKKGLLFVFMSTLFFLGLSFLGESHVFSHAQVEEEVYEILDEDYVYINSTFDPQIGDMFISEDNVLYEIYFVDGEVLVAYAKPIEQVEMPKVEDNPRIIAPISAYEKKIGMYHTHNDESYVIGDGYDSVYGEGGIMDIGDAFVKELKKHNIKVFESNQLHLPHDSKAYVRSKVTAQQLLNSTSLDAIFDVHRDGVPRKQFLGEVNGNELSKIRIVIGKSNPNYLENLEFAKAIKAYADKHYPGLIKDIYMGSGNYNQNLSKTAVLFEMGTYLIEKDYVFSSLPYLADTIDKVMYTDAVESPTEDKSFGETIIESEGESAIDSVQSAEELNVTTKGILIAIFILVAFGGVGLLLFKRLKSRKRKKKRLR